MAQISCQRAQSRGCSSYAECSRDYPNPFKSCRISPSAGLGISVRPVRNVPGLEQWLLGLADAELLWGLARVLLEVAAQERCVADDTDARCALELGQLVFKLVAEVSVLQIVNRTENRVLLLIVSGHATTASAQVRVIVRPVEQVGATTAPGNSAKESSHIVVLSCD